MSWTLPPRARLLALLASVVLVPACMNAVSDPKTTPAAATSEKKAAAKQKEEDTKEKQEAMVKKEKAKEKESAAAKEGRWQSLFDGKTITEWRGFKEKGVPAGWTVVDGAITRTGDGADLVSVKQYRNFELTLEWKLKPASNSGIMFHVTEAGKATYETGPEMQVLDNDLHPDGKNPLTSAGAAYGLYAAPPGHVKRVGEWNAIRLVVNGPHVEQWMNGTKVVSYELWSPDWKAKVAASKFKQWSGYGLAKTGRIALQGHDKGEWVAYRKIRIRELP